MCVTCGVGGMDSTLTLLIGPSRANRAPYRTGSPSDVAPSSMGGQRTAQGWHPDWPGPAPVVAEVGRSDRRLYRVPDQVGDPCGLGEEDGVGGVREFGDDGAGPCGAEALDLGADRAVCPGHQGPGRFGPPRRRGRGLCEGGCGERALGRCQDTGESSGTSAAKTEGKAVSSMVTSTAESPSRSGYVHSFRWPVSGDSGKLPWSRPRLSPSWGT